MRTLVTARSVYPSALLAVAGLLAFAGSIQGAIITTLGEAGDFAVLGLPNTNLTFSNDTVNGNVGLSGSAKLTNMAPSTINGNIYRAPTTTVTGPGVINGSNIIENMTSIVDDALACNSNNAALTPTQTLGNITTATTVHGNGGVNVIDITGSINLGGTNSLILSGTASDIFVVNITGTLTMNGSSQLGISGGVTDDHVLWNFVGSGGNVSLQVSNVVDGTMLAPDYSLTNGDGTYYGGMIFGGSNIKLLSGAEVTHEAFVPEPGTLSLLALGGLALIRRKRK